MDEITKINNPEIDNNQEPEQSPADIIAEMRANSVSREKYDKLQNEYNKVLKAYANGEEIVRETAPKTPEEINKQRLTFLTENNAGPVKFWTDFLEVREYDIKHNGRDPMKGFGKMYIPNEEEDVWMDRVADVVSQCLEDADGDDMTFTNLFNRRINEVGAITNPPKKKKGL